MMMVIERRGDPISSIDAFLTFVMGSAATKLQDIKTTYVFFRYLPIQSLIGQLQMSCIAFRFI